MHNIYEHIESPCPWGGQSGCQVGSYELLRFSKFLKLSLHRIINYMFGNIIFMPI